MGNEPASGQARQYSRAKDLLHFIAGLELRVLASLLMIAGGIWAFVEIADEVLEGETRSIDESILLGLRNATDLSDPWGPLWFEEIMRDFTALGGMAILTMLSLAVVGFFVLQHKKGMSLLVVVSVGGGLLLSYLL